VISSNQWNFSGTADTTDIFSRTVTIAAVDDDRKQVTSTVTWPQTPQRNGVVTVTTYLTNWQTSEPVAACDVYCQSLGTYSTGTCRSVPEVCTTQGEIYESGGDSFCITNFPGDPSHDTCCCLP
jgi:hypothetical protein